MIEVQHLTKRFGAFVAVDDLSFTVQPGEVLGFLGPNGAGKSTTMKMLTGFLEPTSGNIRVAGLDVQRQPVAVKQRIGYLPEGAPAYGDMTVLGFLQFIGALRGMRGQSLRERLADVCAQVELTDKLNNTINTLSKGYKRRVGLAQALLHDPQILILDEPTDGLDPNQKQQVRRLIQNLAADKMVIISTHILEEVSAVCSRAMIIASGRKVADGTPAELEARSRFHQAVSLRFQQPQPQAAALLAALPGITEVDEQDDGQSYLLFPQNGAQLYAPVAALVEQQGWAVDTLHVERGRLDDVFRQLTVTAGGAAV